MKDEIEIEIKGGCKDIRNLKEPDRGFRPKRRIQMGCAQEGGIYVGSKEKGFNFGKRNYEASIRNTEAGKAKGGKVGSAPKNGKQEDLFLSEEKKSLP